MRMVSGLTEKQATKKLFFTNFTARYTFTTFKVFFNKTGHSIEMLYLRQFDSYYGTFPRYCNQIQVVRAGTEHITRLCEQGTGHIYQEV